MRKCLALGLLLLYSNVTEAQSDHVLDSLKKGLSTARTDEIRIYALVEISNYYAGLDKPLSKSYIDQAMQIAELSRDRKLIARTYNRAGNRYLAWAGLEDNMTQAMGYFQQAEKVARESDLNEDLGYAYIGMARSSRGKGDYSQALNYNNLALSVASASRIDSLKIAAYNSMGHTYRYRNEKLLAFRSYLDALNIAELSGRDDLLKLCYGAISDFYAVIEEYDKGLDYAMKIMAIDQKNGDRYALLDDYHSTGKLFVMKKQQELALSMFEKDIALADSLQYTSFKLTPYLAIANMYFENGEMQKGMNYLNSHGDVLNFFKTSGMGFFLDEGYGFIYSRMGKFDSASYYLKLAEPEVEKKTSPLRRYNFYCEYGEFYKMKGDFRMAIAYYLKARALGLAIKDMDVLENSAKNLDSLYGKTGDYKTAYAYNVEYNQYKDSIQSLAKEADVMKLEVDNDNRRRERLAKEEEERTQRRHNVQYMGFTAGIAVLFIMLVMLGFFMVSPRTIRALGFFSFIFLFEFIILLADKQIHEWTHGEPWKILLIKIFLAAGLLPLHHWLEHKVVHYLNTRRKIRRSEGNLAEGKVATEGSIVLGPEV
jgi:tetratricopeptide (TPR) repeat protein